MRESKKGALVRSDVRKLPELGSALTQLQQVSDTEDPSEYENAHFLCRYAQAHGTGRTAIPVRFDEL